MIQVIRMYGEDVFRGGLKELFFKNDAITVEKWSIFLQELA